MSVVSVCSVDRPACHLQCPIVVNGWRRAGPAEGPRDAYRDHRSCAEKGRTTSDRRPVGSQSGVLYGGEAGPVDVTGHRGLSPSHAAEETGRATDP